MACSVNVVTWVALVALAVVSTSKGEDVNVTLLYVNDLRYDIFPLSAPETVCVEDTENCFGGLSRLRALSRSQYQNSTDPALWLNAGNMLGGKHYNVLKFQDAATTLDFLKFNASALGPELFRYGLTPVGSFFEASTNDTILSSNWNQSTAVKSSSLFALGEHCHAAVIGFIDKQKADDMKVFGVSVGDEREAVEREVAAIRTANADKKILYVALGGATIEGAKSLAAIPDIDIVLFSGGNFSATVKPEERAFLESVVVDNKTSWISSVNRNFHEMESRFLIGQLDLQLDEECKVNAQPRMSLVDYLLAKRDENPVLTDFLRAEAAKVAQVSRVVAHTKLNVVPVPDACLLGECSLGGLVADSLVAGLDSTDEAQPWRNATKLAMVPGWIVRNNLNVTGNITSDDLYNFFDQDEYIYVITLTGKQFKRTLEVSASSYKDSKTPIPDFLQVSGSMRVQFEKKKVVSLWVVADDSTSLTLTPVDLSDEKKFYKVAVPSSLLFQQGSNYWFLRDLTNPVFHDVSMMDALLGLATRDSSYDTLPLPVTGVRLVFQEKPPQPADCEASCATPVIIALVAVAVVQVAAWIVWKVLLPKYRSRRGSTTQLLP